MNSPSDPPLVTIIVRTQGHRPQLLSRALASIAAQTHQHLEVIVVEDGSETAKQIVKNANALRPGSFLHLPIPKRGRCAAGNEGLQKANGAYLGLLDEDDEFYPNHVEVLLKALSVAPKFQLAYGRAHIEFCNGLSNDNLSVIKKVPDDSLVPFSRTQLWLRNRIPIQAALFEKALYTDKGGLDPLLDCFEDWDLWLRYSSEESFLAVDELTSVYRMPAAKADLMARETLHKQWLPKVREKHDGLIAMHSFADIHTFPEEGRNQIPFRQALALTRGAFLRRLKELTGGRS